MRPVYSLFGIRVIRSLVPLTRGTAPADQIVTQQLSFLTIVVGAV